MAGNEYFNLTDENSVALIQNGELLEEQAVLIGGEPYAAYTYVESQLNSCFYWDEETKRNPAYNERRRADTASGRCGHCQNTGRTACRTAGDDGTVDFLVSGYMSRGSHEGGVGVSLWRYEKGTNTLTERLYLPANESSEEL